MNAQTNVNNSGQKIRTVDITVTAAMAALVFLGTYIFKIPTISGYVHLGDCMIILTVALFGMKKGAVLIGAVSGGVLHIIAYTLVRAALYGGRTAIIEIPALTFQTGAGIVIGFVIYMLLKKSGVAGRLSGMVG